ncbi:hypothetical protein K2173_014994 [Erythroxylum novogranatense]|uniref:DOG1 domain-containing protein n=1 Tax=Erythroxylum novogranatense TaxID=1862640 RepID=A0AAV8S6K6_9ROSI|nr:hypothetical protein K2173_014994 [Erythroxylum novogranatense]
MGSRAAGVGAQKNNKAVADMPSFVPPEPASNSKWHLFLASTLDILVTMVSDPVFNQLKSSSQAFSTAVHFGTLNKSLASSDIRQSAAAMEAQTLSLQKESQTNAISIPGNQPENWGDINVADASGTDGSTEDTKRKIKGNLCVQYERGQLNALVVSDASDKSKEKTTDQKISTDGGIKFIYALFFVIVCAGIMRLAQNREAARKGIFISSSGDQSHSMSGNGALAFDVEYARWLEEHNKQISELRAAVNSHAGDTELRTIVDNASTHFNDIFRLKGIAAKADVFHILSGMWKTPAERCFMWIGGRSSELLKLLVNQLEPLTEQQVMAIYNLQQSSQQAEDALSQGMEALQQSLAETLANGTAVSDSSGKVANYMGQMAMAMGKLGTLEGFLRQVICLDIFSYLYRLFMLYVQNIGFVKAKTAVQGVFYC